MEPKKLHMFYETEILPSSPFHFDGTFHKPSHFPSPDRHYEKGVYWQTIRLENTAFGVKFVDQGSISEPKILLEIYSEEKQTAEKYDKLLKEIGFRFDLQSDLSEFIKLCENDSVLKPAVKRWMGMRVSAGESLYEFLVITTVLQNATVKRSSQMFENLFKLYGSQVAFDERNLYVFWEPETLAQADEQVLRDLKMGYRAKTFIRQAQKIVNEKISEYQLRTLDNDKLKENLLPFYGIGPASVWYLMFEVFKRYDALDYISPWEQKIYSRLLFEEENVDTKIILENVKARWGNWRMLAVHYLFEDLFWQRKNQSIPWLEELIRL